ncbi:hypothetical protein LWE70_18360, partial [Clostridioides difficile]
FFDLYLIFTKFNKLIYFSCKLTKNLLIECYFLFLLNRQINKNAIPVPITIPMIFDIINFFNIKENNKNAMHKPKT